MIVLIGLLIPAEVTIVPLFQIFNALGLVNTHWPLLLVTTFGAPSVLAAVAIFTFLHAWNLYLEPTVYLQAPELFTLPQALTRFADAYGGPLWNVQLAAATLTAVPVLLVFIVAQRQFVEGLAHIGLTG